MAARYASSQIRNIALVGHGSCGKTSLAEALLFLTGATSRLGSTLDKTSILDFEPEEQKREGSIATSMAWLEHDGCKINLLDTPGDQNFIYDSFSAMRGVDAVIVVISAPDGVEVQTERVFREAQALGLPIAFFVNKVDRERADPDACLKDIEEALGVKPVPLQLPVGREGSLRGMLSLFQRKAYIYDPDQLGKYEKQDLDDEMAAEVEGAWLQLAETIAETDEDLLAEYLETFELSEAQIRGAFGKAFKSGHLVPVLFGAATRCIGGAALLELITWAFPSPLERRPVNGTQGDDLTELTPAEDGDFVAQVIHTAIDEHSGKASVLRFFRGSPPGDGQLRNNSTGAEERLGSLFTLRGKDRTTLDIVAAGDILAVSKLKDTHTGDTLATAGATLTLDRVAFARPMMSFVIQASS